MRNGLGALGLLAFVCTFWVVAFSLTAVGGCSQGATLVRESPQAGVVTYLYHEDRGGPLFSPHRPEAIAIMQRKCPSGYVIVQEAEAKGYVNVRGMMEGIENESRARRWGLQFRCDSAVGGSSSEGVRQ